MITFRAFFPVYVFIYAGFAVGAAIYLLLLVLKSQSSAPVTDANGTTEDQTGCQPVQPLAQTCRSQITRALAALYVVVMAPFFWLALFAGGAGHGTRVPLLIYAGLTLPTSVLSLIRYALPSGSDYDIVAVLPLMIAPAVNVGLFATFHRLRTHRSGWRPHASPRARKT